MKVNFTFSLDQALRDRARVAAKAYDMTTAQVMRKLLRNMVNEYEDAVRKREEKTGELEKARLEAIKAMIANEMKGK